MKYNENKSRAGLIIALVAVLAALWLAIAYGAYTESKREKYMVSVRPGNVSYGTHSTAVIPMVSPTRRSSVPMISGSTVRSYAYYGHSTMPGATSSSGYKIHTLSSATVHTVGSGGGASGSGSSVSGGQGSSSRGITYGGASVSMPTFALVLPMSSSATMEAPARFGMGPRRTKPTEEGGEGDVVWDPDERRWWTWDPNKGDYGDWRYVADGDTRYNSGEIEYWNGDTWVSFEEWSNPGVPLGDAPWLWMILMLAAYAAFTTIRRKQNAI